MIGIDMELPKGCSDCQVSCESFLKLSFKERTEVFNNNIKLDSCPLVDLGKEDMSWEELVEKVRNKISGELRAGRGFYIDIDLISFRFLKCGDVIFEYTVIKTAQTPYQMYQIIKSLVGETS